MIKTLQNQIILGIESVDQTIGISIVKNAQPVGLHYLNYGEQTSNILLQTIDQLLEQVQIKKNDLEGICVCLGPGSFTSVKVSLATAQAMAIGLNIPVYGVDSLTLIAATMLYYPNTIKVIKEAYKNEFYTACFNTSTGKIIQQSKIVLTKASDFMMNLSPNDLILGNGLFRLLKTFNTDEFTQKKVYWNVNLLSQPYGLGVINHFLYHQKPIPNNIPLSPYYVRPSDAELNYRFVYEKKL